MLTESLAHACLARSFSAHKDPRSRQNALAVIASDEKLIRTLEQNFKEACKQARGQLGMQRNSLSTVNALPEHIMLRIFQFAAAFDDNDHKHAQDILFCISRTCAYWRHVSFKTQSLWAHLNVSFMTGPVAALHRTRSENLPLTVVLRRASTSHYRPEWRYGSYLGQYDSYTCRLAFCGLVISMVKELDLALEEDKNGRLPLWLTESRAPLLTMAKLVYHDPEGSAGDRTSWVLTDLLMGEKPCLTSLTLQNLFVPWTSLAQMKALTTLHMHFTARDDDSALDSGLFSFLKSCTKLRNLSLTCHDSLLELPELPSSPIQLRKLSSLRLRLTSSDVSFILQSIATPKRMKTLSIFGHLINKRPKKGDRIIRLPMDPRCLPCLTEVRRLHVDLSSHCITASTSTSSAIGFSIRINVCGPGGNGEAGAETIIATMGLLQKYYVLPKLECLELTDSDSQLSTEDVILFLRHAPLLTDLVLNYCKTDILDQLAIQKSATEAFPNLKRIKLHHMTLVVPLLKRLCVSLFYSGYSLSITDPVPPAKAKPQVVRLYWYNTELCLSESVKVIREVGGSAVEVQSTLELS